MKNDLLKKLTSRKFIVTVIPVIAGVITLFVGNNAIVQTIASAAMVVLPTVVYCIMEGTVDAKSVKVITEATADAAEKLGATEAQVNIIEQMGAVGEVLTDDTEE